MSYVIVSPAWNTDKPIRIMQVNDDGDNVLLLQLTPFEAFKLALQLQSYSIELIEWKQ